MSYRLVSIDFNHSYIYKGEMLVGSLYLFPATERKSEGIEQQWYAINEIDGFVVTGYINAKGQWSLSPPCSREPSDSYGTPFDKFDEMFSAEYATLYESARKKVQTSMAKKILALVNIMLESIEIEKEQRRRNRSARLQLEAKKKSGGAASDASTITDALEIAAANMPSEHLPSWWQFLFSRDEFEEEEAKESEKATDVASERSEILLEQHKHQLNGSSEIVGLTDRDPIGEELSISTVESIVKEVLEQYQSKGVTEFKLPPLGTVTIHVESDYFVLRSDKDGHTVLAAMLDGELLQDLAPDDARLYSEILQESEVERYKLQEQQVPELQKIYFTKDIERE